LASLLESMIEAFNSGQVPSLGDAWQLLATQTCGRGEEEAIELFDEEMKKLLEGGLPLETSVLMEHARRVQAVAIQHLETVAGGDIQVLDVSVRKLQV